MAQDMKKVSLEELMEDIEVLQYNWNIISLGYELWKQEIKEAHNGMSIELAKIAGVGVNYIPRLCNGDVKRTKKVFNCVATDIDVLVLLQGKKKVIFGNAIEKKIRKYIILNNLYKSIRGADKHKKDTVETREILIELCGKEDYREYINKLKKSILDNLNEEDIKKKGLGVETFEYTHIGLIKGFLLGKNIGKGVVILGEHEEYIKRVLELLLEINTDKLSKFNNDNLDRLSLFVKALDDRVMAEVNYRKIKDYENELSSNVVKTYSDMEEEKYKKRSKLEDLNWK